MSKNACYVDMNHPDKGIYDSWADCEKEKAKGGTSFKGFPLREDAEAEIERLLRGGASGGKPSEKRQDARIDLKEPYAFTDGSFNKDRNIFGYGGFLMYNGKHEIQGSSDDAEIVASWNVAGETCGAIAAIEKAKELGLSELTIYYDYEGVKEWAVGSWKTNKPVSKKYKEYVDNCGVKLNFVHVKAHTGIPGNEEADALAKEAAGII